MKKGYPVGIVGEDFTASSTLIEINQVLAVKKNGPVCIVKHL